MLLTRIKHLLIIAALSTLTITAFAEDAPVYDVDNFPPQFDGQPIANEESPPPTQAQPKSDEKSDESEAPPPAPTQNLTQDQRLNRLEQQMKNMEHSDSSSKTETMQAEIQSLRGQVEELSHQLQQTQGQQKAMYTDIDKRLSQQKAPQTLADNDIKKPAVIAKEVQQTDTSSKKISPAAAKTASNNQPNVAEEQQIYQTAYDLIKAKKYNEAVTTLQKMLQKYPSGQFAANAHYWLGELYGLLNKNDQSADEFATVVKDYPDSAKVADAQLKLGLIYAGQFKWPDAKTAFKKVVTRYPGTASARLASEQLKQLKQAQAQAEAQAGR